MLASQHLQHDHPHTRTNLRETVHVNYATIRTVRKFIECSKLSLLYRSRAAIVDEARDMGSPEMRLRLTFLGRGQGSTGLQGELASKSMPAAPAYAHCGAAFG